MDRQTIEAAERVTAWSRARALSAVLEEAKAMNASADAAQADEPQLHERNAAALRYVGGQARDVEDQH